MRNELEGSTAEIGVGTYPELGKCNTSDRMLVCEGLGATNSKDDAGLAGSDDAELRSNGGIQRSREAGSGRTVGDSGRTAETPSAKSIPSLSENTDGVDGVANALGDPEGGGVSGEITLAESCATRATGLAYAEHEYGSIGVCKSERASRRGVSEATTGLGGLIVRCRYGEGYIAMKDI